MYRTCAFYFFTEIYMSKVDILAIGAHPDDVELSCAGTLLSQIKLGYSVALLDLTRGELGSRGSAELRTIEARRAADILGISARENVGLADGFFEHNQASLMRIIPFIRKYRPEVIFANALSDRHPDHGRAAKLTADACFLSGLIRVETTDEYGKPQEPWRPKNIFHYIQDVTLEPDFVIDISAFLETKMAAIMAYSSQFYNPDDADTNAPQTPISSKAFLESITAKNAIWGRSIHAEYAEGFNVAKTLGVRDIFDLI